MDSDNAYFSIDFDVRDVRIIYNSVCFHLDKWAGGDPEEQESLQRMKVFLFGMLLEHNFATKETE